MTETKDRELRVILDNTAPANDAIEPTSRFERALDSQSIDFDREKVTNEDDGTTEYRYFLDEGNQQGKARQLARQNVGKSEHVRTVRYIRHNKDHPPSTENATETGNPAENDVVPKPTYKNLRRSYDDLRDELDQAEDDLEELTREHFEKVAELEEENQAKQERLDRIGVIVGEDPTTNSFYDTLEERLEDESSVDEQATQAKNSETNANLAVASNQVNAYTQEVIAYSLGRDAFRQHHVDRIDDVNTWEEAVDLGRAYLAEIVRDGFQERITEDDVRPERLDNKQDIVNHLQAAIEAEEGEPQDLIDRRDAKKREIRMIEGYKNGKDTYDAIKPSHEDLRRIRHLVEDIEHRRHQFDTLFHDLGTMQATYTVRLGENTTGDLHVPGDNVDGIEAVTYGIIFDEVGDNASLPADDFTGEPIPLQNTSYEQQKDAMMNVKDRLSQLGIDAKMTYDYGRQTTI